MPEVEQEQAIDESQVVVFRLGAESYGIEIFRVNEIIRMRDITPIPGADHHIEGLINLRGKTIPVVDLRAKLNMDCASSTNSTRIIVVEAGAEKIGVIVDAVTEVMTLSSESIEDRPELLADARTDYALSLAKNENQIITILDLDQALAA
jgi:purine-binding chemotaxis protein CheW